MASRYFTFLTLFFLAVWTPGAGAGEIAAYEREMREAYAAFRWAAFYLREGQSAAAEKALQEFDARWGALRARYGNPPPHYSEESRWAATIEDAQKIGRLALDMTKRGDTKGASEALEDIRYLLSDLRRRNRVISLSDHMNAYGDKMEEIQNGQYTADLLDGRRIQELQEQLAVLTYLAEGLERNGPEGENPPYLALVEAVYQSIEKVREAIDESDYSRIEAAIKGLRPPFQKLFLEFG